jgi:TolB protein
MALRSGRLARSIGVSLLAIAVLAALPAAAQRPAVVVTPGKRQTFKVAAQQFSDISPTANPKRAPHFRDLLSRSIEFSNVFEMIDPKAFLGPQVTESFESGNRVACGDWTTIGADAFVEGEIRVEGGRYSVEFRLWDTATCKRLLRKRYRQQSSLDPNILAKRVADDIEAAFTGVRGIASTELAFVSDRTGTKEIYAMGADGDNQRAVTANRSINTFPGWSPDGESILFTSYRHLNTPNVFISTRGKKNARRMFTGMGRDRSQYRGVFDPSGSRVAVVMTAEVSSEIYVVRPGKRKYRRLTKNKVIDVSPTWSPDGKQIAFVSDRGGSPQIYVMDAEGGNTRRLTYDGSYNTGPSWSPDGNWIAYETRVSGQFDIWLISADGTVNVPLVSHPRSDEAPTWAPNSRLLAFSSTRRGRADIYVVGLDGGEPRRLTLGVGNSTSPAWGPFPR